MFNVLLGFFSCFCFSVFAGYYSQCGQDKFVNEKFFKNLKSGVFLDIGAHDGVSLSNTYFFEKELGWSGICLEPIPEVFERLKKNRNCLCFCGCAALEHLATKHFLRISGYSEMLSGLVDHFDWEHKKRIEYEIEKYGGSYEVIDVLCFNLNQLLKDAGINHVNFLSLDTEGGEFEILQNFDFSTCQVDVITVEDNYKIDPFIPFLKSKGFRFVGHLDQDLIFVNKEFRN